MIEDQKLRQDMLYLLGQIQSICYPLFWNKDNSGSDAYYDLLESIKEQYISILKRTIGYEE